MKKSKGVLILLNVAFVIYSLSSVLSKYAAQRETMSLSWILLYGGMLVLLMIYAVLWQMALKKVDLIVAYANKAIVVIWGLVWGLVLFHESISLLKIVGVAVIVAGIVVLSKGEKHD